MTGKAAAASPIAGVQLALDVDDAGVISLGDPEPEPDDGLSFGEWVESLPLSP